MSPNDNSFNSLLRAADESRIYSEQLPDFVTVRRRRMTKRQHERLRRAARKMVQDVRKFIKRKRL